MESRALPQVQVQPRPRRLLSPSTDVCITIDDSLDDDAFLKMLEETLQQHVPCLEHRVLVLSASQVELLALRLHDVLVPTRDATSQLIQAWTIQPQLQLKVKASAHLQVLKLSTMLREVQRVRVHAFPGYAPQSARVAVDIFPSLTVLEVLHVDVARLHQVHCFARQLQELHVEHTAHRYSNSIL